MKKKDVEKGDNKGLRGDSSGKREKEEEEKKPRCNLLQWHKETRE